MTPASAKEGVALAPETLMKPWTVKRTLFAVDGRERCIVALEPGGTNKELLPAMAGIVPIAVTILADPTRVSAGVLSKPSCAKRPGSASTVMGGSAAMSNGRLARSPPVAFTFQPEPNGKITDEEKLPNAPLVVGYPLRSWVALAAPVLVNVTLSFTATGSVARKEMPSRGCISPGCKNEGLVVSGTPFRVKSRSAVYPTSPTIMVPLASPVPLMPSAVPSPSASEARSASWLMVMLCNWQSPCTGTD